ncbi:MAG: endonuclease/exonuclease/phosphatase family protein [Candidatus Hermodarchaeia archaeon]
MTRVKTKRIILLSAIALIFVLGFNMTITTQANDDLNLTISEIQGDGFSTPYPYYEYVITSGVVTADYQHEEKNGFFMQDVTGDGNPATSEGIFVYEPLYDTWPYDGVNDVEVGDFVTVKARSRERYGFTQLDFVKWIDVVSHLNPLPEPVELYPPCDDYLSDVYYESLEGMLVSCSEMRAIAGTNQYGEASGVRKDLCKRRVFQDDPCGTGEIIFTDDAGGVEVLAKSGDIIKDLVGPLDYSYDEYKVLPGVDDPPIVEEKFPWMDISLWKWKWKEWWYSRRGYVTIATYNMYNLFDDGNIEDELAKHALAIHEYLREPDIIAVQEIENEAVLEMLVNTAPIKTDYGIVTIDGPDNRGIDVGLLYNKDRIMLVNAEARQTCTDLDDEYGPGEDPNYPCPVGYNPLFSRPPLVVHLKVKTKSGWCWKPKHMKYKDLWVIVNHFKSKGVYPPTYASPLPRRIQQAEWVSSLVDEIQADHGGAKVVVIGDLNDFMDSEPLEVLEDGGLRNMMWNVNKKNRYTYIYRGVSEVLDHILITPTMLGKWRFTHVLHFNADWPYRTYRYDTTSAHWSTDHDIVVGAFKL